MKTFITSLFMLFISLSLSAQTWLPLYPNGAPDSNGLEESDKKQIDDFRLDWASEADYAVYLPEKSKATGQAIIILPGGGYSGVAYNHEGIQVAKWLNANGIAGIIVRYRMPNGHYEIPLEDVHAAFRLVRQNAAKWGIDPNNLGVMGFSAGGHLASTADVYFDDETRPDFAVLIYPVISFQEKITHHGSRNNLIGTEYNAELVDRYSTELNVKDNTPPTFIALSDDDKVVVPANGVAFYSALKEKDIPGELHIYPTGGHGWGWNEDFIYKDEVRTSLLRWLKSLK